MLRLEVGLEGSIVFKVTRARVTRPVMSAFIHLTVLLNVLFPAVFKKYSS